MLAKPMAVTLPFSLLLLDVWPLRRIETRTFAAAMRSMRRPLVEKTPLILLSLAVSAITLYAQHEAGAIRDLEFLPLSIRLANMPLAYVAQLQHFLWPSGLIVYYPHPGESISYSRAALAATALAAISLAALRTAPARPHLLIGWLWFLGTLGPVIGIVQTGFQAYADRYMYVPLLGPTLMLVPSGAALIDRRFVPAAAGRKIGATLAVVVIGALALVTRGQVGWWQSSDTLFERALRVEPRNWQARQNLAAAAIARGDLDSAVMHWSEAVALRPRWAEGQVAYAGLLRRQGKVEAALAALRRAAEIDPAMLAIQKNAQLELVQDQDPSLAIAVYREELAHGESSAELHTLLGQAYLRAERAEEAVRQFEAALALEDGQAEALAGLGDALQELARTREAIDAYRKTLERRASWPEVGNKLAWLLATAPDRTLEDATEAVLVAEAAAAATGRSDAAILDTLAASYHAAGRLDEARAAAREGLRVAEAARDAAAVEALRRRIEELD